ncbi:MAG TPA: ATP-grasp domain-containing protein [Alloacidobacterium sp.]|nr:ATP-grasp domain-containing protein [Alloacidobacterium sp.]
MAFNSLASLESAIRKAKPDIIVPCDDRVVWQLHELHARKPDLRPCIEASLGAASGYEILQRRESLLLAAEKLGIRIPYTQHISSEDDIRAWFAQTASSAVLKLDGSWGGEGVQFAHSEAEAIAAWQELSQSPGLGTAIKRAIINRDALAFWSWRRQTRPRVTMQRFIQGRPANSMLACRQGELLADASVEVLESQGATGAAFVVRILENEEMREAGRRLAKELKLTGFFGLDFMIEDATGYAYLIELNPRCTQLGHLPFAHGTLAGALVAQLTQQQQKSASSLQLKDETVAFFPQAILWNPQSPYLHSGYHDVPWEQPQLVRELLLDTWPERQWISRLYHSFRPQRKLVPASFEKDS